MSGVAQRRERVEVREHLTPERVLLADPIVDAGEIDVDRDHPATHNPRGYLRRIDPERPPPRRPADPLIGSPLGRSPGARPPDLCFAPLDSSSGFGGPPTADGERRLEAR